MVVISRSQTGTTGALGTHGMVETESEVRGCRHRPLNFSEKPPFDTDVATEVWKTTAPPKPAVLSAKSTDLLRVDGVVYQILGGVLPFTGLDGRVEKVTVYSQRKAG